MLQYFPQLSYSALQIINPKFNPIRLLKYTCGKNVAMFQTSFLHCRFTVAVKINGEEYGRGTGKSLKEAKAVAAKEAWEMIEKQVSKQQD